MKILAFTDVHADSDMLDKVESKLKDADLLICTGDIAWLGHGTEEVINRFAEWKKPMLLVHGNHEMLDEVKELIKPHKHITLLHKSYVLINEILFYGYGGDWWNQSSPDFARWIQEQKFPKANKRVMLVHMPPYNIKQDFIPHFNAHRGNMSYRDHIEKAQPDLVLFGHFHEGFHMKDKIGNTVLINPGPDGETINL